MPIAVRLELQARTRDGPADPCMDHPLTCPSALATGYKPSQACVECIYRAARCGRSATFSVQMTMSDIQVRGTHGAPGSGRPSRNCDGLKCGATAVFGCSAVPVCVEWPANHGKIQAQLEGPLPRCPRRPVADSESDSESAASSSHTGVPVAHTADHTSI